MSATSQLRDIGSCTAGRPVSSSAVACNGVAIQSSPHSCSHRRVSSPAATHGPVPGAAALGSQPAPQHGPPSASMRFYTRCLSDVSAYGPPRAVCDRCTRDLRCSCCLDKDRCTLRLLHRHAWQRSQYTTIVNCRWISRSLHRLCRGEHQRIGIPSSCDRRRLVWLSLRRHPGSITVARVLNHKNIWATDGS